MTVSYDLMVFDAHAAPCGREQFLAWYQKQTEWSEGHSYQDAAISSEPLRAWFLEMIRTFPAMNGPHAVEPGDVDDPNLTDYSIGREVIYAGFAWSRAEQARAQARALAAKHRLGFFAASDTPGEIRFPGDPHPR